MRTVCICSGSPAERGLLQPILRRFDEESPLEYILFEDIQQNNVIQAYTFTEQLLKQNKIDLMFIPCDRQEMVGVALASFYNNVPVVHFLGGFSGAHHPDDITRSIIARVAHLIFVYEDEEIEHLVRQGKELWRIRKINSTAFDDVEILKEWMLREKYDLPEIFNLALLHPDPYSRTKTLRDIEQVFGHLNPFTILLHPNKDRNSDIIFQAIGKWNTDPYDRSLLRVIERMPRKDYLSALKHCAKFIGNSSSAFYELPYFDPTLEKFIHIGERNKERKPIKNIKLGGSDQVIKILEELVIDDKFLRLQ